MLYVNKTKPDRLSSINPDSIQMMDVTSRENQDKREYGIYFLTNRHERYWWFNNKEERDQVYQEIVEFSNRSLLT